MYRAWIFLLLLAVPAWAAEPRSCAEAYRLVAAAVPVEQRLLPGDLLQALLFLHAARKPEIASEEIRNLLRTMADVKSDKELLADPGFSRAIQQLAKEMSEEEFDQLVGGQAASLKRALRVKRPPSWDDTKDFKRSWGWRLLADDDPAWSEPSYLSRLLQVTHASGRLFQGRSVLDVRGLFDAAWARVAPGNVKPLYFKLSGTDANNSLYELAGSVVAARGHDPRTGEILGFDSMFAGAGGRIQKLSFIHKDASKVKIESPHTTMFHVTDPAEIARLDLAEAKTLNEIEAKFKGTDPPIGAFMLEPVVGAKGAFVYRPEFLRKLRKLCDEHGIPIIADEILTGGGRTGKFFAYQHYADFEPDFVTFGKGLQLSGVAKVSRANAPEYKLVAAETTLNSYDEPMLKSTQVLNRLADGKLIESVSERSGLMLKELEDRKRAMLMSIVEKKRAELAMREKRFRDADADAEAHYAEWLHRFNSNPTQANDPVKRANQEAALRGQAGPEKRRRERLVETAKQELEAAEAVVARWDSDPFFRSQEVRGTGLLFHTRGEMIPGYEQAMGRYMPPITITPEQILGLPRN